MSCPNINSPDWKALVKKHGENKAWSIFKNNDNEIPNIDNKIVAEESILDDQVIPQNKTLQEINKNPLLSSKIIDSLKKTFPNVVINKGGVIKEDGTFVPLQPGDKGMSIRNGLHSMVAWANDAYLETPPHEYAHIYIDMYQEAPLVKKAIEKYGKEKLVEKIGRYYTEQYTAPGFKRWVQKFWNMLRRFARNPDIRYELFRAFRENKVLSKNITKGTDIIEYQKAPYKRNVSALYENDELVNQMAAVYNFENDSEIDKNGDVRNDIILNNEVGNRLLSITDINRLLNNLKNVDEYLIEQANQDINVLKDVYRNAVTELRETDLDSNKNYKNVVTLDVTQDLNPFKESLLTDTKNSNVIAAYSLFYLANQAQGDVDLDQDFPFERFLPNPTEQQKNKIKEDAEKLAETYLRIRKRTYRASQEKKGILVNKSPQSQSASYIPVEAAFKIITKEIEEASKKRNNKWFSKGVWQKNKLLKSFINLIIRFLSTEQSNARLQSKFLSGKDDSALQKMLYDEFENARRVSLEMQEKARFFVNQMVDIKENIDGSYFYNKNKSIENIATYEIEVSGNQKIKVTESELLSLYFNLRMPENSIAMSNNKELGVGFVIQDSIENRVLDRTYSLGVMDKAKIEKMVNDNSRLKDVVKNFDNALESMYELLSSAHKSETGIAIPSIENYFPTRYGIADVQKQNQERKNIDFLGQRYAKKGNKAPIRISDAYQVLNSYINNVAHYSAYNLPVKNANKLLEQLRKKYEVDKSRKDYKLIMSLIDALQGNVNNLTDNSYIYSSKSEKEKQNYINKIMSNFSVAVLSLNVPTFFKQPISYLAAKEIIDVGYLKQAGWGVGSIAGISYKEVFKQLKRKRISEGKTIFPAEWKMDENDPLYATIIKYSAILKERFKGGISKEMGEVLLDSRISEDSVRIPFSRYIKKVFGKESDVDYEFSKNAMMAGIKAFDTATVVSIWKAVELEAQDRNGPYANKDGSLMLKKNTKEYYEHVARRTEEIVNKSQPTFDLNNRTKLASSQSPVARFFTMFGSARSKLAMLIIEGIVDYQNNPTPENFKTLRKRMVNITVLSAAAAVAVDLLKQFTLGSGFDDPEDEVLPFVGWKSLSTVTGNFYGLGTLADYVASNLDDEPWRRDLQLPVMAIAEDASDVIVNTFKGNVGKATTKLIEGTFKATGSPLYPYVVAKNIYKRTTD